MLQTLLKITLYVVLVHNNSSYTFHDEMISYKQNVFLHVTPNAYLWI